MKHFFHRLHRPGFYLKLILSHLMVLFLAVAIMSGFNYMTARGEQGKRMLNLVTYSGQQTADSIEARLAQMENVSELIRYSIQRVIGESTEQSPNPSLDAATINTIRSLRDSFGFCDISSWMPVDYFSAREGITFFDISALEGRPQSPAVLDAPYNKLSWTFTQNYVYPFMRFQSYERYNLLSCFQRVSTLSTPGAFCFFIDIDEREIAAMLSQNIGAMPLVQYLADPEGRIISHPDSAMLGTQLDDNLREHLRAADMETPVSWSGQEYIQYPLGDIGWSLIVSIPRSYLFSMSMTSINGILLAVLAASAVSVVASILISRQLSGKLMRMGAVIRSIEPGFRISSESFEEIRVRMPLPSRDSPTDELDELAAVFNTLLEQLNTTMQTALNSSLAHEKLRYQLLRAKINPHFLYNILESIKVCNTLGRINDANLMLSMLGSFYRLILRKSDLDIITIREELEIVDLYLKMEAISHEHCFTYSISLDPDIDLFTIPRFVLQPLVENCVTHGLSGGARKMNISVSLRYSEDAIIITIEDNGLGMSGEKLSKLMQVIKGERVISDSIAANAFYGLTNVSSRLKPYVMDPDEPIHYESSAGWGTRVIIQLRQSLPD